jgi:hypothetical protein
VRARTLLPLLLLLAAGCAKPIIVNAFPGPNLPDADVATLQIDFKVRLMQLDGQGVEGLPPGLQTEEPYDPRILRLLPGEHEMLVGIRPYIETNSYPIYSYTTTTDCEGRCHSMPIVVGYNYTTTHHEGSRENERIQFTLAPGRRYRLKLDDPPDWFAKREKWSARIIEKTNAWRDTLISTSHGREPHVQPLPVQHSQLARAAGG